MAGSLGSESPIQRLVRSVRENPVADVASRYAHSTKNATKQAKARALDVGHPVVVLLRGSRAMSKDVKTWWSEAGAKKKDIRDAVAVGFVLFPVPTGFPPYSLRL